MKCGVHEDITLGAQRALSFFNTKAVDFEWMLTSVNTVQNKLQFLSLSITEVVEYYTDELHQLMTYLNTVKSLSGRLSVVHSNLYDECCTTVPNKGNLNTILQQKSTLEVCNSMLQSLLSLPQNFCDIISTFEEELCNLQDVSGRLNNHLIPSTEVEEFRELSPGNIIIFLN